MKTSLRCALIGMSAFVPLLGCATTQEGRLYRHDLPGVSRFVVGSNFAPSTTVTAQLVDGTSCEGRLARTGGSGIGLGLENGPSDFESGEDAAVAVLLCGSTGIMRCRFVHGALDGYAFGRCEDQRGAKYTVIF
jgi:hypothetical protein